MSDTAAGPVPPHPEVLPPRPAGLPRATVLLLTVAVAVITVAGLRELAWLIGPVFLAIVIVLLVHPIHRRLLQCGVPKLVALLLLLLAIYGVVLALVAVLGVSIARLAGLLPQYAADAAGLVADLADWLASLGIDRAQVRELTASLDLNRLGSLLTALLSSLVSFGANVVLLLSLLLFLGIESTGISHRLAPLVASRPGAAAALLEFAIRTRRFLAVTSVFAVLVGAADTLLLFWLGVPLALLWGVLAAVCNFIPYVGFIIGLVPPALLTLLVSGWREMLVVIVAYIILNSLLTSLIPPYFVGDAVGLSATVTLISVVFWAWMLGPLGAVLAIPLTLFSKAVLIDADPRAAWADGFVGPGPRSPRTRASRTRGDTGTVDAQET